MKSLANSFEVHEVTGLDKGRLGTIVETIDPKGLRELQSRKLGAMMSGVTGSKIRELTMAHRDAILATLNADFFEDGGKSFADIASRSNDAETTFDKPGTASERSAVPGAPALFKLKSLFGSSE